MAEETLTPADDAELIATLAHALVFDGKRRLRDADGMVARVAAARLVEALRASRFVVSKRPPPALHSDALHRPFKAE